MRFAIENLSKDLLTFAGLDLVDNQGRTFKPSSDAFQFIPTEDSCVLENLNPNVAKTCTAIYTADLLAAVQAELGDEGYPPAAAAALKHDLDALKAEYGCQIGYQRERGVYALTDLGDLALLDLPAECMEALAFLDASFPAGAALPEQANLRALLDRVLRLLRRDLAGTTLKAGYYSWPGAPSSRRHGCADRQPSDHVSGQWRRAGRCARLWAHQPSLRRDRLCHDRVYLRERRRPLSRLPL